MAEIDGTVRITREMLDMADRSDDLRPLWRRLAPWWKRRELAVFDRLAPLSAASVRRKRVHKTEPMVATGALQQATYRYSPIKSDADSATFGIPKGGARKAIGAMHATRSGSRPKRDVVPRLTKAEREHILDAIADFVMDG